MSWAERWREEDERLDEQSRRSLQSFRRADSDFIFNNLSRALDRDNVLKRKRITKRWMIGYDGPLPRYGSSWSLITAWFDLYGYRYGEVAELKRAADGQN